MAKERENLTLLVPLTVLGLYAVSFFVFNRQQKDEYRNRRTDIEDKSKLEVHHKKPLYQGGGNDEDNGEALTRPEHALAHFRLAISSGNKRDIEANYWAVKAIVKRMTPDEVAEFNSLIKSIGR